MIDHAGVSEQGHVRFRNEDFITHQAADDTPQGQDKGFLCVVADGVGGSGAGDVASREAAEMLTRTYYVGSKRPERALRDAINRANLHVYDLGLKAGSFRMETTIAAVAVAGANAYIAHVGDSRVYRVRSGQIEPMTRDHSEVAELVQRARVEGERESDAIALQLLAKRLDAVGGGGYALVESQVDQARAGGALVCAAASQDRVS